MVSPAIVSNNLHSPKLPIAGVVSNLHFNMSTSSSTVNIMQAVKTSHQMVRSSTVKTV